jgi:hypothetical protein
MGLDKSYDSFIISLNTTSSDQLTLNYVVSHMLNEEVHHTNVEIQRVVMKAKARRVRLGLKRRIMLQWWLHRGMAQ